MKDSGVGSVGGSARRWKRSKRSSGRLQCSATSPRPIDDPSYFDDDGEYAWITFQMSLRLACIWMPQNNGCVGSWQFSETKMQPGSLFLSIAGTVGKPCIANIKCCIHDGFVSFFLAGKATRDSCSTCSHLASHTKAQENGHAAQSQHRHGRINLMNWHSRCRRTKADCGLFGHNSSKTRFDDYGG